MAEPTLLQWLHVYRIAYWHGHGDYADRFCDVPALTAADALTQFAVERRSAEVREIRPVDPAEPGSPQVPQEVHESGWQWRPVDAVAAFAPPFGTIRKCRGCDALVAGGVTACARCAEDKDSPAASNPSDPPALDLDALQSALARAEQERDFNWKLYEKTRRELLHERARRGEMAKEKLALYQRLQAAENPAPTAEPGPTALDLDALQRRCDAATPGPWVVGESDDILDLDGETLFTCYRVASGADDAALIAAARDALPKLIARVKQLEARIDKVHSLATEFEDNPVDALRCISEHLDLAAHHDRYSNAPREQHD